MSKSAQVSKRHNKTLTKRRSDSDLRHPAAPFKLSWSANEPPIVKQFSALEEFQTHLAKTGQAAAHECFWHRALQLVLHTPNTANLRKWKLVQHQLMLFTFSRPFGDDENALAAALIISGSTLVLFAPERDIGSAEHIAGWFCDTLSSQQLLNLSERLEIIGTSEIVQQFIKKTTTKGKRIVTLGHGLSEQSYQKQVSNRHRVFYISLRHLPDTKMGPRSFSGSLTPGALRLARQEDLPSLKVIYSASQTSSDDSDSEDDDDDGNLDELVKKDKIWVWSRNPSDRSGKGRSSEVLCFAILEYHDSPSNPENSTLELVDIHMNGSLDPEEGHQFARALIDGLCDFYLVRKVADSAAGLRRIPYRLFFVNVDSSMPESSDDFLLECGFQFDCCLEQISLLVDASSAPTSEGGQPSKNSHESQKQHQQVRFTISSPIKVASATEKPFMAYTVEDTQTHETALKRYREFDRLFTRLKAAMPKANLPKPPKKKIFGNLESDFVERRRRKLEQWLNAVSQIPGIEDTALIDDFMASELKRRGIKNQEEMHLMAVLQRANDKPVHLVAAPAPQYVLQRALQESPSGPASDPSLTTSPTQSRHSRELSGGGSPALVGPSSAAAALISTSSPTLNIPKSTHLTSPTSPRREKAPSAPEHKSPRKKDTTSQVEDIKVTKSSKSPTPATTDDVAAPRVKGAKSATDISHNSVKKSEGAKRTPKKKPHPDAAAKRTRALKQSRESPI